MAHQVIPGDPSTPALWAALDGFLLKPWPHPLLGPVNIHAVRIDSGGWAIKGVAGARPVWPRRQSKAAKGKVYVIGRWACPPYGAPRGESGPDGRAALGVTAHFTSGRRHTGTPPAA